MPIIDRHAPGSFCWFELATTDQAAAKSFYSTLFGATVSDTPMAPGDFYSMFNIDGRAVAAAYTMRPEQKALGDRPHWLLYVLVANAEEAALRVSPAGGIVLASPFDVMNAGRMAMVQDPTGAIFAIFEPKNHQGTGITGVDGSVVWADLNTGDPARAKQFYSTVFGWKIAPGQADESGYLHIQNGADMIGGIPGPGQTPPGTPPHWLLYFQTSDCDASAAKLKTLGGQVHMGPVTLEKVGRFALVADPQGAAFALFQPALKP